MAGNFISPLVEQVVRKRAAGFCEWETSTWQYEDITRCATTDNLRCLKTDVDKDNQGVKLLCRTHFDQVLALRTSRKKPKKKPKNKQKDQKNLFG